MEAWKHATNMLSLKLKNDTIRELVTTGLTKSILPKLEKNPPDVETLRQYITLPLFMEFDDVTLYKDVHCPYSKGFISLPKAAWNVVGMVSHKMSKVTFFFGHNFIKKI